MNGIRDVAHADWVHVAVAEPAADGELNFACDSSKNIKEQTHSCKNPTRGMDNTQR